MGYGWKEIAGTAVLTGSLALASLSVVGSARAAGPSLPTPDNPSYVVDPAPIVPPSVQTVKPRTSQSTVSALGLPIPVLNSRPTSTHTIYLDFDGIDLTSASAWTQGTTHINAGTYSGFTLDGSSDFSQSEIDYITKTWRIVAEKYSPFDVNVTTADPGQAALARTAANDNSYGVQVVVTNDTSPVNQICGGNCAGIAFTDFFDGRDQNDPGSPCGVGGCVYDNSSVTVAWVFSSKTFGSAQMTAHDAAHEIGHTMGLAHDGTSTLDYYNGQNNWSPIMGSTNQRAVFQFSKGEYADANNQQDDLALIGGNGLAGTTGSFLLPDDYTTSGGAPTGAAALGDQTSYDVHGIISSAADDDLFSISRTCTSALNVSATGIGSGQSLDIKLDILDASNNVLSTNNPASGQVQATQADGDPGWLPTGMDAAASLASTTAGTTYRVRVDGSGSGTPATDGYSDYGSIGQYHLTISGCPAQAQTVPGPPASITLDPGVRNNTAGIYWTAPSDNGNSAITGYQITGLPEGTVNVGNVLSYDAFNLTPGTTYPITIKAKNAVGVSATGVSGNLRVNTWAPTTKPGLTASLAGSAATVTWTAPSNPGNAVLTGWHVVATGASPVDETLPAATLTKDYAVAVGTTTYTVTGVYTADDLSQLKTSDPQGVTRAAGPVAPDAPASANAAQHPRTNTATISWSAPTSNGGSAVTGYQVAGLPEGTVLLGNVLTYEASGLTPGQSYNLTVRALNSVGAGASKAFTLDVGTWAPTTKPVLTVTRSGTSAVLSWTVPANSGGATLIGWHVDRSGPGLLPADKDLSAPVVNNTTTMAGLAAGTHSFTVTPIYTADDTGGVVASDAKSLLVPTKPSAPKIGLAVSGAPKGAKTATAKWSAPSSTGGTPITSYKVTAYKIVKGKVVRSYTSKALTATARSYAFALPAGTYKFKVVAYNAMGASPASGYSRAVLSR